MFCDITQIEVSAGKGGNGCISLHRAKYVAKGGPDGGDGGVGGSLILRANENLNSLIELHTKKKFKAEDGDQGGSKSFHGRNGEDIVLEVPVGTIVKDINTGETLADFTYHNEEVEAVKGGRGGYGNEHFKSSIRQTPRFAEMGEPGEHRELSLELQLVADVGIIGLPSAGKSTLISVISSAKPKIAEYHFTTLIPNLGVVKMSNQRSFMACDIPGLIEGAADGKGLGDEFLRHITRSKTLIHLVDISRKDPLADYRTIRNELEKYSSELAEKKEIVLFSKVDTMHGDTQLLDFLIDAFEDEFKKRPMAISSLTREGIDPFLETVWEIILEEKKEHPEVLEEREVFTPHLQNIDPKRWEITPETKLGTFDGEKRKEGFRVTGKRFEQIVIMTDFFNREAVMRVRDVMYKMGIQKELLRLGAVNGTPVFVGERIFEFEPLLLR